MIFIGLSRGPRGPRGLKLNGAKMVQKGNRVAVPEDRVD